MLLIEEILLVAKLLVFVNYLSIYIISLIAGILGTIEGDLFGDYCLTVLPLGFFFFISSNI